MTNHWKRALLLFLATLTLSSWSNAAEMLQSGGYAERPLVLPKGTIRIDGAPQDFAYGDFGELNNGRGLFRLGHYGQAPNDFWTAYSGLGAGVGIVDKFEAGALLFPIFFEPADFGNIEGYARYQLIEGQFQLAVQGTVQLPTNARFGTGIGVPMLYRISDSIRLDMGVELELMTNGFDAHLDIPFAFAFDIADTFFLGPRFGARIVDMQNLQAPIGIFMGGTVADMVDITGHFNFPNFVNTFGGDAIDASTFEMMVGGTVFLDVF